MRGTFGERSPTLIKTQLKREFLLNYLEKSETSDDLYVLLNRIRKNYSVLSEDMKLIEMVLERRDTEK